MDFATVRALLAASLDTVADNRRRAELQLKQVSFPEPSIFCVHPLPPPARHPERESNSRKKKDERRMAGGS
jgi:hypothetical protein